METIKAYGAQSETSGVAPLSIDRRDPRPDDVAIRIDYCGICHSDLHFVHNDESCPKHKKFEQPSWCLHHEGNRPAAFGDVPVCADQWFAREVTVLSVPHSTLSSGTAAPSTPALPRTPRAGSVRTTLGGAGALM